MRPIDADALFEHKVYAETPTISGDFVPGFVIDRAPTIDAVPVVRCGDCKWYDSAFYACSKCGVCVNRDFYCADGEKES